ncbi:MAG: hypothetical protein ABUL64_02055, partial [Singulisphaera sp.]
MRAIRTFQVVAALLIFAASSSNCLGKVPLGHRATRRAPAPVPYYEGYSSQRSNGKPPVGRASSAIAPLARRDAQIQRTAALLPANDRVARSTLQSAPQANADGEALPAPLTDEPVPTPDAPNVADETPWTLTGKVHLKPAELEESDMAFPINLATALKLADARPLIVAAAQASAWVAEAELQRAKVLWVPTFNAGTDYIRHDGFGP